MRCQWLYNHGGGEKRCEEDGEYTVVDIFSRGKHRLCKRHKEEYIERLAAGAGEKTVKLVVWGRR
ncbi:MAG: hypothetical protein QW074_07790 [Candidatus Caldarchaeum sp.]